MKNKIQETGDKRLRKGFTLIELLVVISILAILITLGLTTFASAQRKGRDARRKSDLRDVKNALEQYYSVCGFNYPDLNVDGNYDPIYCDPGNGPITILPNIPVDPKSGDPYYCNAACDVSGYSYCAVLETDGTEYCITNSQ